MYFLDFMRPYFYFLGFYALNKYYNSYDFFLFLNIDYHTIMLSGFQIPLFDYGLSIKIINNLSLKYDNFDEFVGLTKTTNSVLIYMEFINNFVKTYDYFKARDVAFLPHISFFYLKQLYFPVYLPIESVQK